VRRASTDRRARVRALGLGPIEEDNFLVWEALIAYVAPPRTSTHALSTHRHKHTLYLRISKHIHTFTDRHTCTHAHAHIHKRRVTHAHTHSEACGLSAVGEWMGSHNTRGPDGTPYECGLFPAVLTFPRDYPLSPPSMKFTCEMFHPNGTRALALPCRPATATAAHAHRHNHAATHIHSATQICRQRHTHTHTHIGTCTRAYSVGVADVVGSVCGRPRVHLDPAPARRRSEQLREQVGHTCTQALRGTDRETDREIQTDRQADRHTPQTDK
jgi:hypothetical protein